MMSTPAAEPHADSPAGRYATAAGRWAGLGPYYAMFPSAFAGDVIARYTEVGDAVLDPFAGRGTAPFAAASTGRVGLGCEINPVGWVFAAAKLRPALEAPVLERVRQIGLDARRVPVSRRLPPFFVACFTPRVRRFLLTARAQLDWRYSAVDRTLAALLMVYLHGKREASLSNQMRQAKAMSPPYAVRWWRERGLSPPDIDPVAFMTQRIRWRYAHGCPAASLSHVHLGDASRQLLRLGRRVRDARCPRPRLLLTSPPYRGVTNYRYDQWLRLWLLGGRSDPLSLPRGQVAAQPGRFYAAAAYRSLLHTVFTRAAALLAPDATVYVRTDYRPVTLDPTVEVLTKVFPHHRLHQNLHDLQTPNQTRLYNNLALRAAETDLVLTPAAGSDR